MTDEELMALATANTQGIAELRSAIAETRQLVDSNARAIEAWSQRFGAERDKSINVELNINIKKLTAAVQTLTNLVMSLVQGVERLWRRIDRHDDLPDMKE